MYEEICGGMNEDAAEHLKKTFTAENNEWLWKKILRFIPCVNIICCHFTERFILPIFRDGKVVGLSKLGTDCGSVCQKTSAAGAMTAQIAGCPDGEPSSKGSNGTC